MIRSAVTFLLILGLVAVAAACGDVDVPDHPDPAGHRGDEDAHEIRLQAKNTAFAPTVLTATTGATKLILVNLDEIEHDFQIDTINVDVVEADDDEDEHGGHEGADLSVHASGGDTDSVTFVPIESGSYDFYCTIPGHKEAGMVGTLTVE